jgi:hypothetical protein
MKKYVNLTGWDIRILGTDRTLPKDGPAASVDSALEEEWVDGIVIMKEVFGDIKGLPDEDDNIIPIVPMKVNKAAILTGRKDTVCPSYVPGWRNRVTGEVRGFYRRC